MTQLEALNVLQQLLYNMADPIELNRLRDANIALEEKIKRIKECSVVNADERNNIILLIAARRMKRLLANSTEHVLEAYHTKYLEDLKAWLHDNPVAAADPVKVNEEAKKILEANWKMAKGLRNVHTLSSNIERLEATERIYGLRKKLMNVNQPKLEPDTSDPRALPDYDREVTQALQKMRDEKSDIELVYNHMVGLLATSGSATLEDIAAAFTDIEKQKVVTKNYIKKYIIEGRLKRYEVDGSTFGVRVDQDNYTAFSGIEGQPWRPPAAAAISIDWAAEEKGLTDKLVISTRIAWRKEQERAGKKTTEETEKLLTKEIDNVKAAFGERFYNFLDEIVSKKLLYVSQPNKQLLDEIEHMTESTEFLSFQPKDMWETMRFCISEQLIRSFEEPVFMVSQDLSNILSVLEAMLPGDNLVRQPIHASINSPGTKMSLLAIMREMRNAKAHKEDFPDVILIHYIDRMVEFLIGLGVDSTDIDQADFKGLKNLDEFGLKQAYELDPSVADDILKQFQKHRPLFPRSILPTNETFTGRRDVLDHLRNLFFSDAPETVSGNMSDGRVRIITQAVKGLGGIGKTEIAKQYCREFRDMYKETGKFDYSIL